jgi:hypothetical protein
MQVVFASVKQKPSAHASSGSFSSDPGIILSFIYWAKYDKGRMCFSKPINEILSFAHHLCGSSLGIFLIW